MEWVWGGEEGGDWNHTLPSKVPGSERTFHKEAGDHTWSPPNQSRCQISHLKNEKAEFDGL